MVLGVIGNLVGPPKKINSSQGSPDTSQGSSATSSGATGSGPSQTPASPTEPVPSLNSPIAVQPSPVAPIPHAPSTGDRSNPIPLGQQVKFDNGWEVTVLHATPSAWPQIQAANEFNSAPEPGKQFFMVDVAVTYSGPGSDSLFGSIEFHAVDSSQVSLDNSGCGVLPNPLDELGKLFTGGQLSGNICFVESAATSGSLVMFVDVGLFGGQETFFSVK